MGIAVWFLIRNNYYATQRTKKNKNKTKQHNQRAMSAMLG